MEVGDERRTGGEGSNQEGVTVSLFPHRSPHTTKGRIRVYRVSEDSLMKMDTHFDEAEQVDFTKDFPLIRVSVRTESESELDTDIHTQQARAKCTESSDTVPVSCDDSSSPGLPCKKSGDTGGSGHSPASANTALAELPESTEASTHEAEGFTPCQSSEPDSSTSSDPELDSSISASRDSVTDLAASTAARSAGTATDDDVSLSPTAPLPTLTVCVSTATPRPDSEQRNWSTRPGGEDEGKQTTRPCSEDEGKQTTRPCSEDEDKQTTRPCSEDEGKQTTRPGNEDESEETTRSDISEDEHDFESFLRILDTDLVSLHLQTSDSTDDEEEEEEHDDDDDDDDDDSVSDSPNHRQTIGTCPVCLEMTRIEVRTCCGFCICGNCFSGYLNAKVSEGTVLQIQCPSSDCQTGLTEYEVSSRLPASLKSKYHKYLIDARNDPTEKTCPRCGHELHVDKKVLKRKAVVKKGLKVTCQSCALQWCFPCQAPWHEGVRCKEHRKGDSHFRQWTQGREVSSGSQMNAQKCPTCKVFIQRSSGCSHMTCTVCSTEFCYDCGGRYYPTRTRRRIFHRRPVRFLLGQHHSTLGPLGCSQNLLPDHTATRRLIRGTVLGAKLLGGVCALAIGAGVAAVVVVVGPVVWGVATVRKKVRRRRH